MNDYDPDDTSVAAALLGVGAIIATLGWIAWFVFPPAGFGLWLLSAPLFAGAVLAKLYQFI